MNSSQPSLASLFKSTLLALILAAIVLVLFILPAEYNIDLTGAGKKLGLTVLAQPQTQVESVIDQPEALVQTTTGSFTAPFINRSVVANKIEPVLREDKVELIVPAGRSIEYKFTLAKHQTLKYQWQTDGGSLYLDLHGEPAGDKTGYFESFTIATASKMKGQIVSPFAGPHGWYWKNNSPKDIKVTLTTQGAYQIIGLL